MGALILLIVACWWPSLAPSPSQPYVVEVSLGDTANTAAHAGPMAPADRAAEAAPESEAVGADADSRPRESEAEADPGIGGAP